MFFYLMPTPPSFPPDTYTFTHEPALSCARGPFCTLWIFYTNTILQMSEWESIKTLALWFYFSPPEKKKSRRGFLLFLFPLSVSSSICLLCSVSLFLLHSIPFIHIQQSIIFWKKKERVSESEWGRKAERNPEIADGSGIFFFMFLSFRIWTGDVEKR